MKHSVGLHEALQDNLGGGGGAGVSVYLQNLLRFGIHRVGRFWSRGAVRFYSDVYSNE